MSIIESIRTATAGLVLTGLLAVLAGADPAAALPALPHPLGWEPASADVTACPIWWRPGEALAPVPHASPRTSEPGPRLAEASGAAAAREARGWIEAGRPAAALAALEGAAETPETRLHRLAALAELERWGELGEALESAPAGVLPPGCAPLRDRWEGLARAVAGDSVAAGRAFDRLADALPEIRPYVDVWRLQAAAQAGDAERGEAAWGRIVASGLPQQASADARALLPVLYERAGRSADARRWHVALAGASGGAEQARHRLAAARLAEAAGDRREADALRARVVADTPGEAAALVLDPDLRSRLRISMIDAARVLLTAGRGADAEPFATAAVESGAGAEMVREALLLRASIREARGDRRGAEADFGEVLSRWPGDSRVPEVLYERARLALRTGDGAVARQRFQNLLARFPSHRRSSGALYLLADSWQDDRRQDPSYADAAIETFDRLARTLPGSQFADRAYMRAAHLTYALGRWADAERRYSGYRGSESAREARYWLARTLEKRGRTGESRDILRSLARADDYYALLARDRLGGGSRVEFDDRGYQPGPQAGGPANAWAILADPGGRRAAVLLSFGERAWAHEEIVRVVDRAGSDRERLSALAPALADWGFPGLALRIGYRLGGEGHPWAWPVAFQAALDREASAHGLDPWYVLALIRQESLWRPGVVSPADARGLMQILPATGREIAEADGWEGFEEAALFDPAVNLHFGAWYLGDQLRRYQGFWPAVLAAYNGGPHVVAVWWDFPERTLDPELWVDRIPFKETREYVRKIVAQRARYRELHGRVAASR